MTRTSPSPTTQSERRPADRRPTHAELYMLARQMQSDFLAETTIRGVLGLFRLGRLGRPASGLAARLGRWYRRRSTLAELRRLDARTLRDIGIDPYDVEAAVESLVRPARDQNRAHLGDVIRDIDGGMTGALRRHDLRRRAVDAGARASGEELPELDGDGRSHYRRATANSNAARDQQPAGERTAQRG